MLMALLAQQTVILMGLWPGKKFFWMDLFNDNQLVIGVISFHLQVFIGPQLQVCKKNIGT